MSCFATFYLLPETKRPEFEQAKRNEPKIIYQRRFVFFQVPVKTGGRRLDQYLAGAAEQHFDFPYSGFAIVSYLFTFLCDDLTLASTLQQAQLDEYYHVFSAAQARSVAEVLAAHPPSPAELEAYAREENHGDDVPESVRVLTDTHRILAEWFAGVREQQMGILFLSF